MDLKKLVQESEIRWRIEPTGNMRVPAVLYATRDLIRGMDQKVHEQLANVASLPGIQTAAYAMPDAHWGYGFPIGGVAAFDSKQGGVVSAGGVGFDISCGVRTLTTDLSTADVRSAAKELAEELFRRVPAGVGSRGRVHLNPAEMDAMLAGGAQWAVAQGYGTEQDLERIEERGAVRGARPDAVSEFAKNRQKDEMGTLGSGNHYLEIQRVSEIFDADAAAAFGIKEDHVVLSIHCGSRGLGHQIGTEFLKKMTIAPEARVIDVPDRELACAPIESAVGEEYLGAMRSAMNCALANRQIITHLARQAFAEVLPKAELRLLYDVSHNTCKVEEHRTNGGGSKRLYVHRKGATRAFGPGHPDLPQPFQRVGQPVLIGGTMGTASYILVGMKESEARSFGSSCHGAGRQMSRHQATKQWNGREVVDELRKRGIIIRSPSFRGVAEEAPGAYKDVSAVVDAADEAGLSRKVARLEPLICIKGLVAATAPSRFRYNVRTLMTEDILDRLTIRQVVDNWVLWRDANQWDRFRDVWHEDGYMMATWFQAPFEDFIRMSQEGFDRGVRILHFLGGTSIDLAGTRAIAQTKMTISQRAKVHDVMCDVVCTGRFYDFFEKRNGKWAIVHRQPIYEKDRMDPVDPGTTLKLDQKLLASFPEGYRHLAYLQSGIGYKIKMNMPGLTGPEVQGLYDRGSQWLNGGALVR